MVQSPTLFALAAISFVPVHAIDLDINSADSIKSAALTIASGLVSYYNGNETGNTVGLLDEPYYWWESGAMFDTLIQYWHLTRDEQYNGIVSQALLAQQGPNGDYMPPNQTKSESNDDQSTWALAAMSAAEAQLPEPSNSSWVASAEAVFNTQVARWDARTCGGGLRWQIFQFNNGYSYKNSASNGQFFELASRLARYTGNNTYSDWAIKAFDWSTTVGFIDENWNVFDGSQVETNCSEANKVQNSLCAGAFVAGAAHMYNITTGDSQKKWKSALDGLLNQTLSTFFPDGIATEVACEPRGTCTTDMKAMKGLLAQRLVDTVQVAPYTSQKIRPLLSSSAQAAAKACSDTTCPLDWNGKETKDDGEGGVGEQLSALSLVQALLVGDAASPVTEREGGDNATVTSTGSGTQTSPTSSGTGIPSQLGNSSAMGLETTGMEILASLWMLMAWVMV